ncbi:hypothetical protein ACQP1K_07155 [Sphaerimonospora sp. CA-214678]|uniref:hypothetical protein n=1 Tax=Sphaerimonospora sp. CA-214678 TaxID=3240029 RepID=UPI003D93111B
MRKSLRLALAAATGVAVFATGAAVTVASPASAASAALLADNTISAPKLGGDLFIPPYGSDKITFTFDVTEPYENSGAKKGEPKYKVWARFTTDSGASEVTWHGADVTQLAKDDKTPRTATMSGSIPVSSSDRPGDKWQLQLLRLAADKSEPSLSDDAWKSADTPLAFSVKPATRVTGMRVNPDPVYLKSGKEIDIFVEFQIEKYGDEKITDVRLESRSSDDYYSLGTGLETDGKSYHDSSAFDYSTPTGSWDFKVSVERGSKKYAFTKSFSVFTSGSSKVKSKIKFYASPAKVKKGKSTKLYGKVYRGSKAWSKKFVKLYFKKKGTKKWKFVTYLRATTTGKFTKTVKPKYNGYWIVTATGTRYTYGTKSNTKYVSIVKKK